MLGAILIWFCGSKAEVWGPELMRLVTAPLPDGALREHLLGSAPHMRFIALGLVLLLVLRFAPRGWCRKGRCLRAGSLGLCPTPDIWT